jgi:DNA-binding transcriptional LysR family regulator
MFLPRISLDQWRSLKAVVETGGYAQAAQQLNRSQSSISYHINRLQELLGVQVFQIVGRKARLTEHGEILYRRAQQLLRDAEQLEQLANTLDQGWEPEINLVVDAAFPTDLLMQALKRFEPESKGTRVQLNEVVLSGAEDALTEGHADLAIGARAPAGYLGDHLVTIDFIASAHPDHPLHHLNRPVTADDLEKYLQVIIRDSGYLHKMDFGWLEAKHQWSVSSIETAVTAIRNGLGFGWLPSHVINQYTNIEYLKPLPLREGQKYRATLQIIFGDSKHTGPATQMLADIIKDEVHYAGLQ